MATLKTTLFPPIALKELVVLNVKAAMPFTKLSVMVAPPRLPDPKDTPVTTSPLVVAKGPRSSVNEPLAVLLPKKLKLM